MGEQPDFGPEIQDRLSALGINPGVLLTDAALEAEREAARIAKHEAEVQEWREAVQSVRYDTARLRENLETRLKASIERGFVRSQSDAAKRLKEIDEQVARGPERSYTYNYSGDPKYNKTQPYYVTLDENENIWGEFPHTERSSAVSQYPVRAGKHIIRRNPTIK